jgi:hypothetical protein
MCSFLSEVRALITIPKQVSDLLIFFASSNYCPDTLVLDIFSDPAKSTKYSLLNLLESVFIFFSLTCI